jgi:tetratricopeptide (TPR) repeat protein
MIVKNEAENIVSTLTNLCSYFNFDYWVISDTGSTDRTKELITDFFEKKKISGELFEDKWQDFGHNRSVALQEAYNKTDYLLIFDADDKIEGTLRLPKLTMDKYLFMFGPHVKYVRPLLINNRKKWKFIGVLHEYLELIDQDNQTSETIQGNYHVVSGRTGGDRNKNVNKYYDDAMILMKAFFKEMGNGNKSLAGRYAFYCAQSFRDTKKHVPESIEWYKKVLELDNWNQEKYFTCIQLGILLFSIKKNEEGLFYYLKSNEYDNERVEGISMAMDYYRKTNNHLLVNLLYHKFKTYKIGEGKLFIYTEIYTNMELDYHNSISAFYANDKESGAECCKKILLGNTQHTLQTFLNLKNYKEYITEDWLPVFCKCNEYIENKKNEKDLDNVFEIWNILFEKVKPCLTRQNNEVLEIIRSNKLLNAPNPFIFFSFMNTQNIESFKDTIHSILNTWTDIEKIDYWFCVDSVLTREDRGILRKKYKWIKFHFDGGMETIHEKLKELRPTFWIHVENGVFHTKMNYVCGKKDTQIKYNRNHAKTIKDYTIKNYMNFTGEYVENSEMTTQTNYAFSINDVNPPSKLSSNQTIFLNKIVYEIR